MKWGTKGSLVLGMARGGQSANQQSFLPHPLLGTAWRLFSFPILRAGLGSRVDLAPKAR